MINRNYISRCWKNNFLKGMKVKRILSIQGVPRRYLTGKSLSEPLLFAEHGENMLCTKIVLNVVHMFSPGLNLELSCIELVIQ